MLRALVRPLRVFLAGAGPHPAPALAAPLQRCHCSLAAPLLRRALPAALPSPLQGSRAALPLPLHPNGAVRWGSRKAGSNSFKTKSSIKKRFRITGGGALRRLSSGKRHLNLHKSSSRIHRLGAQKTIKNKGLRKRYLRVFGLSPFHK